MEELSPNLADARAHRSCWKPETPGSISPALCSLGYRLIRAAHPKTGPPVPTRGPRFLSQRPVWEHRGTRTGTGLGPLGASINSRRVESILTPSSKPSRPFKCLHSFTPVATLNVSDMHTEPATFH